jgi:hypothetical protein
MYDETNVPGPEYKVRPVVRYLVTVYFHPYLAKDQSGFPLPIEGSSKVVGEFEREDRALEVQEALQKRSDQHQEASAAYLSRKSIEHSFQPTPRRISAAP